MNHNGQVLIIEDDPAWREILEEDILPKIGCEYEVAKDLEEGRRKLARRFFHLVVIDLNLDSQAPQSLDGMRVLYYLKYMQEGTQGLVLTGQGSKEVFKEAYKSGDAFHFFEKNPDSPQPRAARSKEIERYIRDGIRVARQQMRVHTILPSDALKDPEPMQMLPQHIGIAEEDFKTFLDGLLDHAYLLFDNPALIGAPRILAHRKSLHLVLTKRPAVAVVYYWDRLYGHCLMVRLSTQAEIEREHAYFTANPDQACALGFKDVSRPFTLDEFKGFAAMIYLLEERTGFFEEFDHPWGHLWQRK